MTVLDFARINRDSFIEEMDNFKTAFFDFHKSKYMCDNLLNFINQSHSYCAIFQTKPHDDLYEIAESYFDEIFSERQTCITAGNKLKNIPLDKASRTKIANAVKNDKYFDYINLKSFFEANQDSYQDHQKYGLRSLLADLWRLPRPPLFQKNYHKVMEDFGDTEPNHVLYDFKDGYRHLDENKLLFNIINDADGSWITNELETIKNYKKPSIETPKEASKTSKKFTNIINFAEEKEVLIQEQAEKNANNILVFSKLLTKTMELQIFNSVEEVSNLGVMFNHQTYMNNQQEEQTILHSNFLKHEYKKLQKNWYLSNQEERVKTQEILKQKKSEASAMFNKIKRFTHDFQTTVNKNFKTNLTSTFLLSRIPSIDETFGFVEITLKDLDKDTKHNPRTRAIIIEFDSQRQKQK